MVPQIPVIAMTVPEPLPAPSSFDAAVPPLTAAAAPGDFASVAGTPRDWAGTPTPARRVSFDSAREPASLERLAGLEAEHQASAASLDAQVQRAASGRTLQVADALRLRHDLNTHVEMLMFYKKVSDTVTNGLQTLARGN